jgi:uncharacterized protein
MATPTSTDATTRRTARRARRPARTITAETARRLAISRQRLDVPTVSVPATPLRRSPEPRSSLRSSVAAVVELVHELGYVQLDPISVVERSPLLVLRSRLGAFEREALDVALYEERQLFEYWSHQASVVPSADRPLHRLRMRTFGRGDSIQEVRVREFMAKNQRLRRALLLLLRREGPQRAQAFAAIAPARAGTAGWRAGGDVEWMLTILWIQGVLVVASRTGGHRTWDLAARWFPETTPRQELSQSEVVRRQVERSLRALGAATSRQISQHYNQGCYPGLERVHSRMESAGEIVPVSVVAPGDDGLLLPGDWYVHSADLDVLDRIEAGEWAGRTILLSPFDNLLIDRARTEMLFAFHYRMEIYVPRDKRRHGYYVLPLLHGDRLIGRIDAKADRGAGRLQVVAVHAEPGAPRDRATVAAIGAEVAALASFSGLGGSELAPDAVSEGVPAAWRRAFA